MQTHEAVASCKFTVYRHNEIASSSCLLTCFILVSLFFQISTIQTQMPLMLNQTSLAPVMHILRHARGGQMAVPLKCSLANWRKIIVPLYQVAGLLSVIINLKEKGVDLISFFNSNIYILSKVSFTRIEDCFCVLTILSRIKQKHPLKTFCSFLIFSVDSPTISFHTAQYIYFAYHPYVHHFTSLTVKTKNIFKCFKFTL